MNRAMLTSGLGFQGILVEDVRYAGLRFDAVIEPDDAEVARRARSGLEPMLDRDLLEALFALPLSSEILVEDVDPIIAAMLSAAPNGIVEFQGSRMERLWKPAVSVVGVMVSHRSWQRGLEAASLLAADAPRALNLVARPTALTRVKEEAEDLGIGLIVSAGEEPQVVVLPSLVRRGAPSPRHWSFLETVFAAWRAAPDYRLAQAVS
jgi:hypothetical protein